MQTKKSIKQKIEDMDINTGLLYDIGGTLDNLKVLNDIIVEKLECDILNTDVVSPIVKLDISKIHQLACIVENENNNANRYLQKLINQIEK